MNKILKNKKIICIEMSYGTIKKIMSRHAWTRYTFTVSIYSISPSRKQQQ